MDGILVIDKPAGITSHDVVSRVRRTLGTRRVGHTGTLDPFATGVLVVVVGRATRLAQFIDKDEKEYIATVRLGVETDTGDRTGNFRSQISNFGSVTASDIEAVLPRFIGQTEQMPPMYSAKKIAGKKLYQHARKGETVDREPTAVTISTLELLAVQQADLELRVVCSAGTYIRVLAEEIGRAVGTGAHLAELRRTRAGRFDLDESVTLDDLSQAEHPAAHLQPITMAVEHLATYKVAGDRVPRTLSGLSTRIGENEFPDGQPVRMLSPNGDLLAIGIYEAAECSLRPKVVLG